MNERILEIRKELRLSQDAFARRLGMNGSSISLVEGGKRNLTEQLIKSICREYNVNEQWFRTGTGEMFLEANGILLAEQIQRYNLDELDTRIVEEYMKLTPEHRQSLKSYILSVAKGLSTESAEELPPHKTNYPYDKDYDSMTKEEKLAVLARELDEQEKGQKLQVSTGFNHDAVGKMA